MTRLRTADEIEASALRAEIVELLAECTEKQQEFFKQLYPEGLDNLPHSNLRSALALCQRTIQAKIVGTT